MDWQNVFNVIFALIAIYAACLSTFNYLRDKAAIKVKVHLGLIVGQGIPEHRLFFKAINVGRRPVIISGPPSLILDNEYHIAIFSSKIPAPKLEEGEVYEEWIELGELREALVKSGGIPKAVRFRDTVGREHIYRFKRNEWSKFAVHIDSKEKAP